MKRILTVLAVGIFLASSSYAQNNNKLDKGLNDKVKGYKDSKNNNKDKSSGKDKGKEKVRVILKTIPSLKASAEGAATKLGGKEVKKFRLLSANVVEITVDALEELSKNPGVHSISLDARVKTSQVGTSHVRATTGAQLVSDAYGATGSGIGIAIVDSGIANVPDLQNVVKSVNLT